MMGSPPILDFQMFVSPLSENAPTGIHLKSQDLSGLYHHLKDTRAAARDRERQGLEDITINKKLWNDVYDSSLQILQSLSKDLEVCAWLIEAMVRKFGYAGFRDGYRLVNELVTVFWENLYPQSDEEGVITRVAALTGLNGEDKEGTLIMPLSNIPLTETKNNNPLVLWQYKQANIIEHISDPHKKEEQFQKFGLSLDSFKKSVIESSPQFLMNLIEDLQEAIEEYKRFDRLMTERCQQEAPPTSTIKLKLEEAFDAIIFLTKDILPKEDNVTSPSNRLNEDVLSPITQKRVAVDSLTSRQEAFKVLSTLSDFFRRTEPHSPLSYILARAVRWGQLSLPELMLELITDERSRAEYCILAGIDLKPQTGE